MSDCYENRLRQTCCRGNPCGCPFPAPTRFHLSYVARQGHSDSERSEESKVLAFNQSPLTQIDAQERTIYPIFMTEPISFRRTRNCETQRDNLRTRARKIRHVGIHLKLSHDGAFPMCASLTQLQNPHPDGANGVRQIANDREMSEIGRSPNLFHCRNLSQFSQTVSVHAGQSHVEFVGSPSVVTPAKSLSRTQIRGRSPEGWVGRLSQRCFCVK